MVITDPWCSLIKSANSVKMEFSARATLSEPSGLHLTRSSLMEVDSEMSRPNTANSQDALA